MKIRTNYVSNSSSSSFCVVGIVMNDMNKIEELEDKLTYRSELQLQSGIDNYYEEYIVGLDVTQMKDNETLFDFKKRVYDELKKYDIECNLEDIGFRIDGGYEG